MNTTLDSQISTAQRLLDEAFAQKDLALAQFALGMLTGAIVAAAPEADRYSLGRVGFDASRETKINLVLDAASWLIRRAYDYR